MTSQQRRLMLRNEQAVKGTRAKLYAHLVDKKIRERYSLSDELAILRQRDTKPAEFAEYNAYCEACKAEARKEIEG